MTLKSRPTFNYISQFFLIPQVDGKVCLVKRFIKDEKVKGSYVAELVRGEAHEIAWGNLNKWKARQGFTGCWSGWVVPNSVTPQ